MVIIVITDIKVKVKINIQIENLGNNLMAEETFASNKTTSSYIKTITDVYTSFTC